MSQGTTTHPPYDVAGDARRAGVIVVAAAVVVTLMLLTHGKNFGGAWNPGFTGGLSLFSWAHWILLAIVVVTALALVRTSSPTVAAVAAVVALGPAAQLVGVGIVAHKRWEPVGGFGPGPWANQRVVVIIAILGALAAAVAVLACLRVLWATRDIEPRPSRAVVRPAALIGAGVAVAVPLLLTLGDPFAHDKTSLGAFALLWSLPWGGTLVLTSWLSRPAAIAAALTVAVSSASAYPKYDLVSVEHGWIAVLVGLGSGLLVAALRLPEARPVAVQRRKPLELSP